MVILKLTKAHLFQAQNILLLIILTQYPYGVRFDNASICRVIEVKSLRTLAKTIMVTFWSTKPFFFYWFDLLKSL